MMAHETADILVVGLGPAGSRAAAKAAGLGRSVIAVDRRRAAGHPVQCAEFVPAMIGQELRELESVSQQRIRSMMTFVEDQEPDIRDNFPGHIIDRAAFDRALVELAREAGADCRFGAQVNGFLEDHSAQLSDGSRIRARLIIGADGPRSVVGQSIDHVNTELVETRQITVPLKVPHQATDIFLSAEIAGGYGWLFPKREVANLGVGVRPTSKDRLKPLLDGLRHHLIEQGRIGTQILNHTGGPIPVGGMLRLKGTKGKVPILLAGDAGGLANPVTGAGINSAVVSGGLAGQAASDWLAGKTDALDDYQEEMADLFKGALDRAVLRRQEILRCYEAGSGPTAAMLRRGWIAYPEYWAA